MIGMMTIIMIKVRIIMVGIQIRLQVIIMAMNMRIMVLLTMIQLLTLLHRWQCGEVRVDILTILPFLVEREEKVDILTILGLGIAGLMTDLEKEKEKGKGKVNIILLPFLTGPRAKAKERAVIPIPMVRESLQCLSHVTGSNIW